MVFDPLVQPVGERKGSTSCPLGRPSNGKDLMLLARRGTAGEISRDDRGLRWSWKPGRRKASIWTFRGKVMEVACRFATIAVIFSQTTWAERATSKDRAFMILRPLGRTGLHSSPTQLRASSLGQEFRPVDLNQAIRSVHVALDLGMNFIDTSPYYGRG